MTGDIEQFLGTAQDPNTVSNANSPFAKRMAAFLQAIHAALMAIKLYVDDHADTDWLPAADDFYDAVQRMTDVLQSALNLFSSLNNDLPDLTKQRNFLDMVQELAELIRSRDYEGAYFRSGYELGSALAVGLAQGLNDKAKNIELSVINVTDAIKEVIKETFGIHSPSKVMAEYGGSISEGLALGIASKADQVARELAGLDRMVGGGNIGLDSSGEFSTRREVYIHLEIEGKDLSPQAIAALKRELILAVRTGA